MKVLQLTTVASLGLFASLALAGLAQAGSGEDAKPAASRSPAEVYRQACSSCHAPDGRGQPRTVVGFDTGLPDFTDCTFASREPDPDWANVVREGGPARAFDRLMPAFGSELTEVEIQKVARIEVTPRGESPRQAAEKLPRAEQALTEHLETIGAENEDEANEKLAAHSRHRAKLDGARDALAAAAPRGVERLRDQVAEAGR